MGNQSRQDSYTFVVLEDRWIPQGYFDTWQEAEAYASQCRRRYLGSFTVQPCAPDGIRTYDDIVTRVTV